MAGGLEYDETQVPPNRPCAKCATIGNNNVCVRQLGDIWQPSCLDEIPGHQHGVAVTDDPVLEWCTDKDREFHRVIWRAEYSVDEMQQNIIHDCHSCAMFLNELKISGEPDSDITVRLAYKPGSGYLNLDLTIVKVDRSDVRFATLEFLSQRGANEVDGSRPLLPTLSTRCRAAMERLRLLYWSCLRDHSQCRKRHVKPNSAHSLPTRLLDLSACTESGKVYLVNGHDLVSNTIYMTLSHTWGTRPCLKLNKLTHETLASGYKIDELPPTFREACFLAQELKCNYIWIDSLCIIQDSKEDWLQESAQMDMVYANSSLTIAASASKDSYTGLFCHRNPRTFQPAIKLHCACGSRSFGQRNGLVTLTQAPLTLVERLPLHRRAWVYQEMALSRRVAYFTDIQVLWVCLCCVADELTTKEIQRNTIFGNVKPVLPHYQISSRWGREPNKVGIYEWSEMIEEYSALKLTFAKDRLVALAGMARVIQDHSEGALGRYRAGLWETFLMQGLTWYKVDRAESVTNATEPDNMYPAPTWSWASVENEVSLDCSTKLNLDICMAHVVEIDIRPVSDTFGALREGRLRLGVHMIRFAIDHPSPGTGLTKNDARVFEYPPGPGNDDMHIFLDHPPAMSRGARPQSEVFYFIKIWEAPDKWGHPMIALCLEPTRRYNGQYRRVGIAMNFDIELWKSAEASNDLPITDDAHLGRQEDGKYIIDLV